MASSVDRHTSKVKSEDSQTTVASLSCRKNFSSSPKAIKWKLAVEVTAIGTGSNGCTPVQLTYTTSSGSRINLMYKSTNSFGEEYTSLVTVSSTSTTLQMADHFPMGHQKMMVKVEGRCVMMNYGT
jgi:hypothetical protein